MRIPIHKDNRGIALLMTLAFITLAISLALETNRQSRFSIESCEVRQHRVVAGQLAAAGMHAAMAILIEDRYASETDHLKEVWSDSEQLNARMTAIAFEEGRVEVAIQDESARIQVNALVDFSQSGQFVPLQQRLLERLIQTLRDGLEEETTDTTAGDIVNAIKDWLDSGDDEAITGLNGAESDYYQDLDPPYRCRNGPMRHIRELGRVKGVTATLMNGNQNQLGLMDYLTVFGAQAAPGDRYFFPGAVNLNTVSRPVLKALLPPEIEDLAEMIVDFRDAADLSLLENSNWYKQAPGATDGAIDPAIVSFASDLFRIRVTAVYRKVERRVTAVVGRRKTAENGIWGCRILDWEID